MKKLAGRVDGHRAGKPGRKVEVWAFDEHRVGLKPIPRRRWSPSGRRPIAVGHHRFEWLHIYRFVHPATGEAAWSAGDAVDVDLFGAVLASFAGAVGAGEDKLVALVLDRAGRHIGDRPAVPEGVIPEFLPSRTPEPRPAERLWPLTDEAVADGHLATLEDLDAALGGRCRALVAGPDTIKGVAGFGWWPAGTPAGAAPN